MNQKWFADQVCLVKQMLLCLDASFVHHSCIIRASFAVYRIVHPKGSASEPDKERRYQGAVAAVA